MTIDKSLKIKKGLARARSVLTRAERLKKLAESDRWSDGSSPLGLPKVRVTKLVMKKKKKAKEEEEKEGEAAGKAGKGGK
jgi:small basic protein (TIGR04137 family)